MPDSAPKCTTYISTATGVRQCSRRASHYLPSRPAIVSCGQHARTYDVPFPKKAR